MSDEQDTQAKDEADLKRQQAEMQERADKVETLGYMPTDVDFDELPVDLPERNGGDLREPGYVENVEPGDAGDAASDEPEATDAAEKLAAELNVDLSTVTGTGADGRVTVSDVKAAADKA